jgi:hypothetical protein
MIPTRPAAAMAWDIIFSHRMAGWTHASRS